MTDLALFPPRLCRPATTASRCSRTPRSGSWSGSPAPAQTRALKGHKRKAKNDRPDARWLALLPAKEMPPARGSRPTLPPAARANVEAMFALIVVLDEQLAVIDAEI